MPDTYLTYHVSVGNTDWQRSDTVCMHLLKRRRVL